MGVAKWKWDAASNKEIWWEPACSKIVPDPTQLSKPILRVCVFSDWFHRIDRLATKQQFGYGFYQSRCRFKGASGMHSAFWLLPEGMKDDPVAPGEILGGVEIDVVENRKVDSGGNDLSKQGNTAVHWGGYGANHKSVAYKLMALPDEPSKWATFAVWHFQGGMKWYWNGKEVNSAAVWSPMKNSLYFSTEVNESTGWAGSDLVSYGALADPEGYIEIDYCGFWEQLAVATKEMVPKMVLPEDEARQLRAKLREVEEQGSKMVSVLQERVDLLERRLVMELAELKELVQSKIALQQNSTP